MRELPVPLKVPVPKVVAPDLKVTVPVGAEPVTVAVRTLVLPTFAGLVALLKTVVVAVAAKACDVRTAKRIDIPNQ